jgi:hypothetical protein
MHTPPALPADGLMGLSAALPQGCLPGERGYLQARLRGALQAQLDWRGAGLACQGGIRADQHGIRLSFGGPLPASARRLRIIIGIDAPPGSTTTKPAAANVTVILEGEGRIYATRGAGHCEVESLTQEPLPLAAAVAGNAPSQRQFRVAARGYCIDPLPVVAGDATGTPDRLYIDRFDFAALASFEPESFDAHTTDAKIPAR